MTTQYRYQLQRGSKKYSCPACNKRTFVRYLDTKTESLLPDHLGRCDRELNCGYWAKPERKQPEQFYFKKQYPKKAAPPKRAFVPAEELEKTLSPEGYSQNSFLQYFLKSAPYPLPLERVQRVVELYYIGTTKEGFTTFPYIDNNSPNRVQAVQAVQFDQHNHRLKATFLHSLIENDYKQQSKELPQWLKEYKQNETKVGCLFGEHLLARYPLNKVGIVEAPKTAITCNLYFGFPELPQNLLWLAAYNLSGLTEERCRALTGRTVLLFPDLSKDGKAYNLWKEKAAELSKRLGATFLVSDYLETIATPEHRQRGLDLADFLLLKNWQEFEKPAVEKSVAGAADEIVKGAGGVVEVGAESAANATPEKPLRGEGVFQNTDTKTIDKVFGTLFRLQVDTKLEFAEKLPAEKLFLFVELVKYFIRNDLGQAWGFYIEFNNSYTTLKKFRYWGA